MIRKLLVAVLAIAMSMGTAVAVDIVGSSVAGAATPPPTNYNCTIGGTVTFKTPGLSAGGALTSAALGDRPVRRLYGDRIGLLGPCLSR